jgi:putative ABC transport system permease protein
MEDIKGLFKIAFKNLRTRRLRSWLTVMGIVIGVFLVITLLSLSQGIKESVSKQLKSLGKEIIMVIPGEESNFIMSFMGNIKLEEEDVSTIRHTRGVERVIPMDYTAGIVRYKGEAKQIFLTGLPLKESLEMLKEYQGWRLKEGRWPVPFRREVVVGSRVENDIFKNRVEVGQEVFIGGRRIEVVGILDSFGNKQDDSSVFLDTKLYQEITGLHKNTAKMAIVKVREGWQTDEVAKILKANLEQERKRKRGEEKGGVMVLTSEKMGNIASSILGTLQIAVIGFALIAVIVGGIGIMNTMFTSVRERIREIGIMKAIGAKNSTISLIFLLEAGIIGFLGGVGGTISGVLFAKLIETYFQVHPIFYLRAYLSPGIIIFGLLFSFVIGCLSGYLPARSAAKLKPAEALRRYE